MLPVALVGRAVLVDHRAPGGQEDRRGDRRPVQVGREDEPPVLRQQAVGQQPEEAARLDRHPKPVARQQVQAVERLHVGPRVAPADLERAPLGLADVALVHLAEPAPHLLGVRAERQDVAHGLLAGEDPAPFRQARAQFEPVEAVRARRVDQRRRQRAGRLVVAQRRAVVRERQRHPAPPRQRAADVEHRQPRPDPARPVGQGERQRPVAVAVGQQPRPGGLVEGGRRRVPPHEVGPAAVVEGQQERRAAARPPLGLPAGAGQQVRLARVRRRHAPPRFRKSRSSSGASTAAGRGSSGAKIANSSGPRSDRR